DLANDFADQGSKFFSNTKAFNSAREADVRGLLDRDHSKTTESARKLVNEVETEALKANPRGDDPLESWFKRVDDAALNRLAGMLEERHPDSLANRLIKKSGTQGLTFDRVAALVIDPRHPNSLAILADRVAFGENHGIAEDMIGAATLNQVGNGHTLEYYKERGLGGQNTEMFANITALYSTGEPLVREYLQTVAPQTTTLYTQALEDFNNGRKPSK
ncbi:MAG: hypothetical protein VKL39_24380, partial [Leptolyngbyaceae bacterium]|nr:hypothetical protein [Leptolyngbyaceae bacterium]